MIEYFNYYSNQYLNRTLKCLPKSVDTVDHNCFTELWFLRILILNKLSNNDENMQGHRKYLSLFFLMGSFNKILIIFIFSLRYKFVGNKTSIYKQIGNAVPPKMAYFLAEMINIISSENIWLDRH